MSAANHSAWVGIDSLLLTAIVCKEGAAMVKFACRRPGCLDCWISAGATVQCSSIS